MTFRLQKCLDTYTWHILEVSGAPIYVARIDSEALAIRVINTLNRHFGAPQ